MLTFKQGFTLIELLIVVIIIGIVSTVALYAFGDFGASRNARVAAEQFRSYTSLLQQRAILESSSFGLTITSAGYNTARLEANGVWVPQSGFFHPQHYPAKIIVELKTTVQDDTKTPSIIINPSGDMTPFVLQFGTQASPKLILLIGSDNGELTIQKL